MEQRYDCRGQVHHEQRGRKLGIAGARNVWRHAGGRDNNALATEDVLVYVAMTRVTLALGAIDGHHDDVGSDSGMMSRCRSMRRTGLSTLVVFVRVSK